MKTNWYVITGGPSSGKSKTIEALAFRGHNIIPEAARILIDQRMSLGEKIEEIRKDEFLFQRIVLAMKIDVEEKIPVEQLTFYERGIPDSIAYYLLLGAKVDSVMKASRSRRYKGIFMLEPLPYEQDYARVEDQETIDRLYYLLPLSYKQLGYDVISVPAMSISERVEFILERTIPQHQP